MSDPRDELIEQVLGALAAREPDDLLQVSFSELEERRSVEVDANPKLQLVEVRFTARPSPDSPSSNARVREDEHE